MPINNRILVIDDDDLLRKYLTNTLKAWGHELRELPDGRHAVREVEQFKPALVMTDILMPHKEGIETISDLKDEFPDIKIVAMSGGGDIDANELLQLAQAFGALEILRKPFTRADLQRALMACGLRQSGRSASMPSRAPFE